jgi:hypothetical protein
MQCADVAVDTVGDTSSSFGASANMVGELYQVNSDRHLIEVEMYLALSGDDLVTWFVYEAQGNENYRRIFETTQTATGDGTNAFLNSGPISVQLVAGRQYYIGLTAASVYIEQGLSHDDGIVMTSFGQHLENVFSGFYSDTISQFDPSYPVADHGFQRLTTVP